MKRVWTIVAATLTLAVAGCGGDDKPEPTSSLDLEVSLARSEVATHCVNEISGEVDADEYGEQYGRMLEAVDVIVGAVETDPENEDYVRTAQRAAQSLERCGEPDSATRIRDEIALANP